MAKQKHLILGLTGGIGRATANSLSHRNIPIRALVRDAGKAAKYTEGIQNIEIVTGDASQPKDLKKAFEGIEVVYYCINIPYNLWEQKALKLLKNCVDAAIEHQVKFVFPGNVYVYGHAKYNPVDEKHPHAAHTNKGQIRMEMEEMLALAKKEHSLNYTIVRMPDFYGPFVINGFSEQLLEVKQWLWQHLVIRAMAKYIISLVKGSLHRENFFRKLHTKQGIKVKLLPSTMT